MQLAALSDTVLEAAIRAQPTAPFDTHDVIFWITRNRAREYAADLHAALANRGDPFDRLHTAISKRLASLTGVVQQQRRKRMSLNVRGKESRVEVWTPVG